MSLLVDINLKGKIILRPIVLKMIPELSGLTEDEALVIILVYDNFSPFRQLNERDRIGRAILHVYEDNNPKLLAALENKDKDIYHRISLAVMAYRNLQYDHKRELINTFHETVNGLRLEINSKLNDKELETKLKAIELLGKYIRSHEKEVVEELIDQGRIEGDKALSFLEELMADPKNYKAVIRPKDKIKAEIKKKLKDVGT